MSHGRRDQGQFHAERGAIAGTAFYGDRATLLRDDPLCYCKTKPSAALRPAPSLVNSIEALEDLALLFLGES